VSQKGLSGYSGNYINKNIIMEHFILTFKYYAENKYLFCGKKIRLEKFYITIYMPPGTNLCFFFCFIAIYFFDKH